MCSERRPRAHRRGRRRARHGWLAWTLGCALALSGAAHADDRCVPQPRAPAPRGTAAGELEAGNAALRAGDAHAAIARYHEAERLASAAADDRLVQRARANALRARVEAGETQDVTPALEAFAAGLDASAPAEHAHLAIHLARTWQQLAARDAAQEPIAAQHRAALLQQATRLAQQARDARLESYAQGYQGELYAAHGRIEEARTLTRRALLAAARADAPDALYRWQWQLGRLARQAGDDAEALTAYRQPLATLARLRADLALSSAEDAFAFRSEVEPAYVEAVDLLLRRAARTDTAPALRQQLLAETRDTLESLKAAELRDHFRDACLDAQRRTTPEAVPRTAVLYPVILPDRLALIVGTDAGLTLFESAVDGPTLTETAHRFRALLTKRTTRQYLPVAQQLYDWLIRPIAPALEGRALDALVVVPGGALRGIPFAALHDARADRFLIEKIPVAVSPGLTLTEPRAIDRERVQGLVAGISQAVHGFAALDAVKQEVQHVAEDVPSVVLLDDAFRAARFEAQVASRPVGIVHVASHGEFNADASQSFILAWDGRIPMDEFAETVGRTRLRTEQPLELLVLSACQTATGDDRAALGLAGVALRAGARSALATLWSVDDEAAAVLVTRFYDALAGGASRARALQTAQRALLEDPTLRHPAYWAPYLLISSWL